MLAANESMLITFANERLTDVDICVVKRMTSSVFAYVSTNLNINQNERIEVFLSKL